MQLADVLKKWRRMADISIREAAARMKISAATLSRIENGEQMDGRTLAKLFNWLTQDVSV